MDELARRFGSGDVPVRLKLRNLPDATRHGVADLLGTARTPRSEYRLDVERLLLVLGLPSVIELREVVEVLRGPLPNRRADREANRTARQLLWSWLGAEAGLLELGGAEARLESWVSEQKAAGARGGVEAHRFRLELALNVLRRLPADGISLAALANDVARDPHALDHGRTLSGMVLDAIACAFDHAKATDAESARSLWETAGVVPDPHSSTVLALGLPGDDRTLLGDWLSTCQALGEAVVLSLSNLRRWPVAPLAPSRCVYVVENPSLIAAANRNWEGPPLVCTSGRPTIAAVTLIRQLTADGAVGYQHADFDPAGLAISSWLAQCCGTVPWRMTASDYLGSLPANAPEFSGSAPETPWDPTLHQVMQDHRRALYEEEIRFDLLLAMNREHAGYDRQPQKHPPGGAGPRWLFS